MIVCDVIVAGADTVRVPDVEPSMPNEAGFIFKLVMFVPSVVAPAVPPNTPALLNCNCVFDPAAYNPGTVIVEPLITLSFYI
jgi:hypothetical protein